MNGWIIAFGILILFALIVIGLFNSLSKQRVLVKEASADIETFLKQRYDMIPNLVEIVKGYAKHEESTLKEVTEMRTKAMGATSFEEKAKLEDQLSKGISKIFAVAESYPDLKANQNFLELQNTLKSLEDDIQKARRFYNGTVRDFNAKIVVFPNNIIANMLKFTELPFFEATEEEKQNVKVQF